MYSSQVRRLIDLCNHLDRDIFDIEIGALDVGDEATEEITSLNVQYFLLRTLPPRSMDFRHFKDFLQFE